MKVLRRMGECQRGGTALEFALVSLFMILVSIAVVDFGRGLYVRNHMSYAADLAARAILTKDGVSDAELENEIRAAFSGPEPERLVIEIGSEILNGVTYRTVTVGYPLALKVPGLTDRSLDLSVARRVPVS